MQNVKAAPTSILASYEACSLLIGPQAGPDAHMAAPLRPSGSHLIRVTEEHLELLVGGPVRYNMKIARPALEKLGAAREDTDLKTQTWDRDPTT